MIAESPVTDEILSADRLLTLNGDGAPVGAQKLFEIERFLLREARLLDDEKYRDWFELLDPRLRYWAPLRENRFRRDKKPEISPKFVALFDETKPTIDLRLQRLESGMAWAEDPPTRHVYAVSNIEAFDTDEAGCYEVHSVFTLYRHRSERDDSTLMGRRRDLLVEGADGFKLIGRLILLQQSTLLSKNLSVFF